jgi:ferredoxin
MCFRISLIVASLILSIGLVDSWSISSRRALHQHSPRHDNVAPANNRNASNRGLLLLAASPASDNDDQLETNKAEKKGIDVASDPRLYRIRLSRAAGIEWGTDLSFAFVYIRALDPSGEAAMSGQVQVGDQLCELRAVIAAETENDFANNDPVNLVGAPFDFVMEAFANLDRSVKDLDLIFFRGTRNELKAAATGGKSDSQEAKTVTITIIENKGSPDEKVHKLTAPAGVNIRQLCVDNGINVYQSVTRWTNCKGKQLCGTCIVNLSQGAMGTNRKSMDEASTLRENPDSYRLSCVTQAYGDCTIETFPPIKAAQWTR